jgi:hypothetical protein
VPFGSLIPSADGEDWCSVEMPLSELAAVPGLMLEEEFIRAISWTPCRFPISSEDLLQKATRGPGRPIESGTYYPIASILRFAACLRPTRLLRCCHPLPSFGAKNPLPRCLLLLRCIVTRLRSWRAGAF